MDCGQTVLHIVVVLNAWKKFMAMRKVVQVKNTTLTRQTATFNMCCVCMLICFNRNFRSAKLLYILSI